MNKYLKLALCIALPLLTGALAGVVTSQNIPTWYSGLTKPSFNPPNYLFAPVWTTLYILMGIGWYLILQKPASAQKTQALGFFYLQWVLNFIWSFLFFQFHALGWALAEILLMWLSIATTIHLFKGLDRRAAFMQIPYLCWVSFAIVLNASIWWLNK
jgi:translocator protein